MNGKTFAGLVGFGVLVILCIVAAIYSSYKNNQVVSPVPGGPDAPVVPQIQDLGAELSSWKARCEGHKETAKTFVKQGRISEAELSRGQKLYTEVKAEQDSLITFLQLGLSNRFRDQDANTVARRLQTTKAKVDGFVAWVNSFDRPLVGDFLGDLASMVNSWLDRTSRENAEAIKAMQDNLEKCRMEPWQPK